MAKKKNRAIILIIIFSFGMSISIPLSILSISLSPYTSIDETCRFEYSPHNSSEVEELILVVDVGNIKIQYETTPVDYFAMIEVKFNLEGYNLFGKNYSYYFDVPNNKNIINFFNLVRKSNTDWTINSKWIKKEVEIIVNINANILFEINTTIREEGDIEIWVPWGTSVNNLVLNTNIGDITYELIWCSLLGNITGDVDSGDITLIANNVKYAQDSIWDLTNNKGIITFDIIQNRAMGSNVTGMGKTNTGKIIVNYQDDSSDIGAMFKFYNYTRWTWYKEYNSWIGFDDPIPIGQPPSGSMFTSFDFPSIYNYELSFFLKHDEQESYMINLTSI